VAKEFDIVCLGGGVAAVPNRRELHALRLIKTAREDHHRVRLSVRDVGVGLPPQSPESLFDAFYTTKSAGMGIGLFVSRSIVDRRQGRLGPSRMMGQAPRSRFRFRIKRHDRESCDESRGNTKV
jgi:C4-dicarboxylate-specific signal transduction histidine kinase